MRGLAGRLLPLLFSLVLSLVALNQGAAQDATPADMSPNPEECTLEARGIEELQAIYGEPAPEGAGEATSAVQATPADLVLPTGSPADEATTNAIMAAIRVNVACYNAGDYLASFSGVTDDFLVTQVGTSLFDQDFVAAMEASPVPLAEEQQTELLSVREIVVLDDGRAAALVDYRGHYPTDTEGINGVETDLWIFANVEGAWLLDEVVENLEGTEHGPDDLATPAP
jgi:hypothetical protein